MFHFCEKGQSNGPPAKGNNKKKRYINIQNLPLERENNILKSNQKLIKENPLFRKPAEVDILK